MDTASHHNTQITEGKRPSLSDLECPDDWKRLIALCWSDNSRIRPSFSAILSELSRLRETLEDSSSTH